MSFWGAMLNQNKPETNICYATNTDYGNEDAGCYRTNAQLARFLGNGLRHRRCMSRDHFTKIQWYRDIR